MTVRLMGLDKQECQPAIEALKTVFRVVEVRGPYENRDGSEQVRYYITTYTGTPGDRLCPGGSPSSNSST
jgi:hypothetical protein